MRGGEDGLSSLWCHTKAQFTKEFSLIASKSPEEMGPEQLQKARNQLLAMHIAQCKDFSSKKFTFHDDALPAMDSLTTKLAPYLGNYHAGIWEHNILLGLQWEAFNAYESHRHQPCCAPTWSWASTTGGAVWCFDPLNLMSDMSNREFDCQVLAVNTIPEDGTIPFGKAKSAEIFPQGWARPAMIEPQETDDIGRMYMNVADEEQWIQMDLQDDIDEIPWRC